MGKVDGFGCQRYVECSPILYVLELTETEKFWFLMFGFLALPDFYDRPSGPKGDLSISWSKVMLLKELHELPQDEMGLRDILFPNQNGRLPVTEEAYNILKTDNLEIADEFIVKADGSKICAEVSTVLRRPFYVKSELDVSVFVGGTIKFLFVLLDNMSPHSFKNKVPLNKRETSETGSNRAGATGKRTRPDTLVTTFDCTFLVGEDKVLKLFNAEAGLGDKLWPFSLVFYGPVMFMLGYMTVGTTFQWVYLSKDKELKQIPQVLELSSFKGLNMFLLSVGYAYKLIEKMVDLVPTLPGRWAMFSVEFNTEGNTSLDCAHDSVLKTIKGFSSHCEIFHGISLEVVQEAYNVGKGCKFLAHATRELKLTANTYSVRITPLGCEAKLDSAQNCKKMAQNVCILLAALHRIGIVHRDVRLPNIVKVFESQTEYYFMVIDLETVAKAEIKLSEGFDAFHFWTEETLEGKCYTPRLDMYHLGMVLRSAMKDFANPLAKMFIGKLIAK